MSKDYKNRIPAYRQRRQRRSRQLGLIAAFAAVFAALAGVGVYHLTRSEGEAVMTAVPETAEAAGQGKKAAGAESRKLAPKIEHPVLQEPRFSFYKVLPEKEVIVSEAEIKNLKRDEKLGKSGSGAYLVQAGSFTSQQEAEKLKTRLGEINVKARLELIKLDNTAWYRVKLGPYANLGDADKVRQHLRANRIDSVVQKARPVR